MMFKDGKINCLIRWAKQFIKKRLKLVFYFCKYDQWIMRYHNFITGIEGWKERFTWIAEEKKLNYIKCNSSTHLNIFARYTSNTCFLLFQQRLVKNMDAITAVYMYLNTLNWVHKAWDNVSNLSEPCTQ